MSQDEVINSLRTAEGLARLNVQDKGRRKRKFKYTIILQDEAQTVKDITRPEKFSIGDIILDISSGKKAKIVRRL